MSSYTTPNYFIFCLWEYSRYAYFRSLGVLPVCLFWVSGSTPSMLFFASGSTPGPASGVVEVTSHISTVDLCFFTLTYTISSYLCCHHLWQEVTITYHNNTSLTSQWPGVLPWSVPCKDEHWLEPGPRILTRPWWWWQPSVLPETIKKHTGSTPRDQK